MKIKYSQYSKPVKVKAIAVYKIRDRGYAFVRGHYKDMLRYDTAFINKADLDDVIAKVNQDPKNSMQMFEVRVLYVKTTDSRAEPTVGRWNSFGISIKPDADSSDSDYMDHDYMAWFTCRDEYHTSEYKDIPLRDLLSA